MYPDLKQNFQWDGLKRDVTSFLEQCLAWQLVKDLHLLSTTVRYPENEYNINEFWIDFPKIKTRKHNHMVVVDLTYKIFLFLTYLDHFWIK